LVTSSSPQLHPNRGILGQNRRFNQADVFVEEKFRPETLAISVNTDSKERHGTPG